MDAAERIGFAVRFSRLNLQAMNAHDLKKLRDEAFGRFLGLGPHGGTLQEQGGIVVFPNELSAPGAILVWDRGDYKGLQADVRSLLREVIAAKGQPGYVKYVSLRAQWGIVDFKGTPVPCVSGPARDLFLVRLFFLLVREGIDRLRKCPECGNIFYRVRRQIRCSSACTNRALVRAFREREIKRAKKRRQRRRRHR